MKSCVYGEFSIEDFYNHNIKYIEKTYTLSASEGIYLPDGAAVDKKQTNGSSQSQENSN